MVPGDCQPYAADSAWSCFAGAVTGSSANTADVRVDVSGDFKGLDTHEMELLVVQGKGLGQIRRMSAHRNLGGSPAVVRCTVSPPWDVPPDATSVITAGSWHVNNVFHRNTARGSKSPYNMYYGGCYDCVDAEATSENTEGWNNWGRIGEMPQGAWHCPVYFNQLRRSTFTGLSPTYSTMGITLRVENETKNYRGIGDYGTDIRDNTIDRASCSSKNQRLAGNAAIATFNQSWMKVTAETPLVFATLCDGNKMKNSSVGFDLDGSFSFAIRGTTYENCLKAVNDNGHETAQLPAAADPLPPAVPASGLKYDVSWVGNSFSGASNKWVQNFFIHMNTAPDGSCFTWSHWDEGGKKFGVYRGWRCRWEQGREGEQPQGQGQAGPKLDDRCRSTRTLSTRNGTSFRRGDHCDGKDVKFPDLFQPTALAVANDGRLMVADSLTGPRQQVLFYDVSDLDHPKLTKAFGDYGGIASGTPGEVTPTKFWGIRGIGMDAEGNIYVAMSEMGTVLRKFTPAGKLVWELYGHFFVDVACADPLTDGNDVWGIQEHYVMDYTQPGCEAGRKSEYWVIRLDRHKYPNDPRGLMFVKQQGEHGLTSPQIVYLKGRRFMFVGGMFASATSSISSATTGGRGKSRSPPV